MAIRFWTKQAKMPMRTPAMTLLSDESITIVPSWSRTDGSNHAVIPSKAPRIAPTTTAKPIFFMTLFSRGPSPHTTHINRWHPVL